MQRWTCKSKGQGLVGKRAPKSLTKIWSRRTSLSTFSSRYQVTKGCRSKSTSVTAELLPNICLFWKYLPYSPQKAVSFSMASIVLSHLCFTWNARVASQQTFLNSNDFISLFLSTIMKRGVFQTSALLSWLTSIREPPPEHVTVPLV